MVFLFVKSLIIDSRNGLKEDIIGAHILIWHWLKEADFILMEDVAHR